ncbi:MAG: hypothetical protein JF617_10030 [Burkholderiales bacterium]|nr:hypothetical protein [Burkholderiales bacterium]
MLAEPLAVRQTVAPPPLPQLCACASGAALAPKASSNASIKDLMFYLSVKVLGRLSPPVTSVMERRGSVHGPSRWIRVVARHDGVAEAFDDHAIDGHELVARLRVLRRCWDRRASRREQGGGERHVSAVRSMERFGAETLGLTNELVLGKSQSINSASEDNRNAPGLKTVRFDVESSNQKISG